MKEPLENSVCGSREEVYDRREGAVAQTVLLNQRVDIGRRSRVPTEGSVAKGAEDGSLCAGVRSVRHKRCPSQGDEGASVRHVGIVLVVHYGHVAAG